MNNYHEYFIIADREKALQQLKENSHWFLGFGIAFLALGTLAILFSWVSTIASVIYLGALLIAAGVIEEAKSFKIHRWGNFFLHLFLGILYVISGLFIIIYPELNALSLTLLLAVFFVVSGILKMIFGVVQDLPHRGWLFVNGLLGLILGILIWHQWPASGFWVLGTFVGIELLFTGWTWIMLAMAARNIK